MAVYILKWSHNSLSLSLSLFLPEVCGGSGGREKGGEGDGVSETHGGGGKFVDLLSRLVWCIVSITSCFGVSVFARLALPKQGRLERCACETDPRHLAILSHFYAATSEECATVYCTCTCTCIL